MARVLSTKEFDTWEKLLPKEYQEQIQGFVKNHQLMIGGVLLTQ